MFSFLYSIFLYRYFYCWGGGGYYLIIFIFFGLLMIIKFSINISRGGGNIKAFNCTLGVFTMLVKSLLIYIGIKGPSSAYLVQYSGIPMA